MDSHNLKNKWLREIAGIRFFEENLSKIYSFQVVRCPVHLSIGHEASAVGICSHLTCDDRVLSYHRSHHHYLAMHASPEKLLYELLGDEKGCSGGNGGSTHLYAPEKGFLGSSAIISGILPVASGVAHALKMRASKNISVAFCGDAAIEEGVFFETLNLASLLELPLLIVVEDNDLSCYTNKKMRQGFRTLSKLTDFFEIDYAEADGASVQDVYEKSSSIIEKMRKTSRPAILHIHVYRAHEHCGPDKDDHLSYRSSGTEWLARDPLIRLSNELGESAKNILNEEAELSQKLFNRILGELGHAANI